MDTITWKVSPSGTFSLVSAWHLVRTHGQLWSWARLLWHQTIPKSYSFIGWRVLWRRVATLDRVKLHNFEVNQVCRFCEVHDETVDHLFFACDFTREIWRCCCLALHLSFGPHDITFELVVLRLPQLMKASRGGILTRLSFLTWLFTIWEERNARIFDHQSR